MSSKKVYFSKSSKDILDIKKNFIKDDKILTLQAQEWNRYYSRQPRRTKCKICEIKLPKKIFRSHFADYTVCKNCGHLKIDDPRSSAAMCRPSQKDGEKPARLFRETHYEPIAGRCIMFPSWLMHCVDPNESNDIRISVSFNFLQKCMIV